MNEVRFIDTTIRDGQMSLWATMMRTDMILPIAPRLEEAGFEAIEILANGFEKKMVRELREDPWERMDLVRQRIPTTPLRVIRSRYLAAFHITPPAVDVLWYDRIAAHGMRQARISDPSNTAAGWRPQVAHCRNVGLDPIVNLIFSISPKHTDEYYARKAREAAQLDVYRICLKDPGALLTPERVRTLVPVVLANAGNIPVELHTHCITGLGPLCCLEAIKLGIKLVNAAIPPLANASSNPSLFNVIKNARALGYTPIVNEEPLKAVEEHLTAVAKREGLPLGAPAEYDSSHYIHQVPGGMISNLVSQLKEAKALHRLAEVYQEVAVTRKEMGTPPLVTPTSQIVGVQAVLNVLFGKYKMVTNETRGVLYGLYGKTPTEPDPCTSLFHCCC